MSSSKCISAGLVIIILVALAFLRCQIPARCAPNALTGRTSHTHKLAPVPREYRGGAHYRNQSRQLPNNIWFRIPNWLAGAWANKDGIETTTYYKGFTKHRKSTNSSYSAVDSEAHPWGHQRDGTGQVWQYAGVPYTGTTRLLASSQTDYQTVYELAPVAFSNDQLVVRYLLRHVLVDDRTRTVVRTYGIEEFQSINRSGQNLMTESDMAQYDQYGTLVSHWKVVRVLERVGDFVPVNKSAAGQDLQMLFRRYLLSQGLNGLVADPQNWVRSKAQLRTGG